MVSDLLGFLNSIGGSLVPHSGGTYADHLLGVYKNLLEDGFPDEVCRAGFLHSIYGTDRFDYFKFDVSGRSSIRKLVGARAERIVHANCFVRRDEYDRIFVCAEENEVYRLSSRIDGDPKITLDHVEFRDLCVVHLSEWLEQVSRLGEWSYRRKTYEQMCAHVENGKLLDRFIRVYERHGERS